jgi:hypothetical protein
MSRHIAHVTLIEVIHVLASRYPDFVAKIVISRSDSMQMPSTVEAA